MSNADAPDLFTPRPRPSATPGNGGQNPPLLTLAEEWLGWTLDRTEDFPRSHRHTFALRLDAITLELLECLIEARFATTAVKRERLIAANLLLEKLRVLWRLVQARGWISKPQLLHAASKLDEMGRMAGGWLKTLG